MILLTEPLLAINATRALGHISRRQTALHVYKLDQIQASIGSQKEAFSQARLIVT